MDGASRTRTGSRPEAAPHWRDWLGGVLLGAVLRVVAANSSLPPVILAAGDIADCGPGAASTAALLERQPGLVLALGDLAYPKGSAQDFARCFTPAWGRVLARTRAVPGNHDYASRGAEPYFTTLGRSAGSRPDGYYSFDFHGWHVLALNSHVAIDRASAQMAWLRADLAQTVARCRLAFVHLPRFSSGEGGDQPSMDALWKTLAAGRVSVVLAAHDHLYERFAPLDADAAADPRDGVRSFTVGTGGAHLDRSPLWTRRHSERLISGRWGVLKLELAEDAYRWSFLDASGGLLDSGHGRCRNP